MPSDGDVWVIAEQGDAQLKDVSLEMVSEGRKLADKLGKRLCAVIVGSGISDLAQPLVHLGADKVWLLDNPILETYHPEIYTDILSPLIETHDPAIVLSGHTTMGGDLASRLAARLKTGFIRECTALSLDGDGSLVATKPSYEGRASISVVCRGETPVVASIKPGMMEIGVQDPSRTAEIHRLSPECTGKTRTRRIGFIKGDPKTIDLKEAEGIVAGGGGASGTGDWPLIEALAEALGASVAASRVAVDQGCVSAARQVGQTGKTVKPRFYAACGISGAIQHIMGMKDSELIIAINKDRNAPIFKIADVGIVGDLKEILPEIIQRLRELKDNGTE